MNIIDPIPSHRCVAVFGLGCSGIAAAHLLHRLGKRVIASDCADETRRADYRLSGAGARILRQSPRVSKSDNGRYSLTASQYINVSSASCDKAAHGVVCEYEARIARFPWGQSYRALTAQSGFAGALLPTAIRAQARPIAVGNTGSARPIGLRRYGLVRGYVLTALRAYTAFFFDCLARSEQQKEIRSLCKIVHWIWIPYIVVFAPIVDRLPSYVH